MGWFRGQFQYCHFLVHRWSSSRNFCWFDSILKDLECQEIWICSKEFQVAINKKTSRNQNFSDGKLSTNSWTFWHSILILKWKQFSLRCKNQNIFWQFWQYFEMCQFYFWKWWLKTKYTLGCMTIFLVWCFYANRSLITSYISLFIETFDTFSCITNAQKTNINIKNSIT